MRRHIPCVLALAATHALPALRSRIKKEGIQEDAKTSNGRRLPLFARFDDSFGGEPTCAVPSCVWNTLAPNAGDPADTTCIQRVNFLVMYKDKSRVDACDIVATDPRFSEICSKCPTCTVECSEVEDLKAQVEELKQFTDKLKHFFTDGCGQPCVPIKVATLPLVQGRYQVEDSNTCVEVDGDYGAFGLEIARSLSCTKVMVKSGARLGAIAACSRVPFRPPRSALMRHAQVHGTDTGIVNDGEVNYISTTPQLRGQFATGTKIINTGTAIGGGPVTIGVRSCVLGS